MKKKKSHYETYIKGEQLPHYRTLSGIELKECYKADDIHLEGENPGEFPYTRGIHKDMYRKRLWTRRQQAGYGLPEETNKRFIFLLEQGMTGINFDPDNATKIGVDADHPLAEGQVGLQGTSVSTLEDMDRLFDNIPLDKVSSTLIINSPTSAVIFPMYLLIAKKRGISPETLRGTIMNCACTQLIGPNYQSITKFYPLELAMKTACDVIEYSSKNMTHWNSININAYNCREYCINAIQEAAFAFTLAEEYIRRMLERGLDIDHFAGRMAFFTSAHIDFLEEIAKLRAMRRIWARLIKEKYSARDERSSLFRTAIQTSGLVLTAQEPLNNIVRATIQTLAAVLGGSQSIHTTSYDEAYALPTEESHKLSIRTQQIIGFESNVCSTVDPLGGSYAIEWLTNKLEGKILDLMEKINSKGGFLECFKNLWIEEQINESRNKMAEDIEKGDMLRVGVNIFDEEKEEAQIDIDIFRHSPDVEKRRRQYLKEYRKNRNEGKMQDILDQLCRQMENEPEKNCIPLVMEALEAKATLGEIVDTFRKAYDFEIRM
ncbi:MAG: acyl-CoA mutase large subunit family protein [Desulfobacteraceae bacterium]|jgi:methylmalonyl-CoA mutase N-terminal domain/subunit